MAAEGRIANPQGQSEIERAVDIDGRPLIIGSGVFAATYQGKVGGLQLANGRPIWVRDASSYVSIAEGFGNVYVAEADGTVSAYEVGGGALRWQNDQLLRRQLSAPAAVGGYARSPTSRATCISSRKWTATSLPASARTPTVCVPT